MPLSFLEPELLKQLETADASELDAAAFGIVGMSADGVVVSYNTFESRLAGLDPTSVVGRHFFSHVAPCTNNYLVAERFETELDIDAFVDYVFTLRMQPTKVRLRLMKRNGHSRMFLAVEHR